MERPVRWSSFWFGFITLPKSSSWALNSSELTLFASVPTSKVTFPYDEAPPAVRFIQSKNHRDPDRRGLRAVCSPRHPDSARLRHHTRAGADNAHLLAAEDAPGPRSRGRPGDDDRDLGGGRYSVGNLRSTCWRRQRTASLPAEYRRQVEGDTHTGERRPEPRHGERQRTG